ncbi:4Fe-4S binding protein [candidate division KSB1 bacterium]|nr:4Fe-4S binding protein [candidate division KSB1 bacterium]
MKRKMIHINEDLCNGCGECIVGCSEGALQLVDGKAKLVKEDFCDGFGDCVGSCPTGALTIEEREAVPFDENAVKEHLLGTQGIEAVWRMEEAQQRHEHKDKSVHMHMGCPGSRMRVVEKPAAAQTSSTVAPAQMMPSELGQWPVQIHLVSPQAPYFDNKELVVMSTCGPLASADIHWRFLRGRSVVVACPKLDDTRPYPTKLAAILQHNSIPKIIVPRMEVPCCGGLTMMVQQAVQMSGKTDVVVEEMIIGVDGSIRQGRQVGA